MRIFKKTFIDNAQTSSIRFLLIKNFLWFMAFLYQKPKVEMMGIPLEDDHLYMLETLSLVDDQIVMAQDYDNLQYMTRKLRRI